MDTGGVAGEVARSFAPSNEEKPGGGDEIVCSPSNLRPRRLNPDFAELSPELTRSTMPRTVTFEPPTQPRQKGLRLKRSETEERIHALVEQQRNFHVLLGQKIMTVK